MRKVVKLGRNNSRRVVTRVFDTLEKRFERLAIYIEGDVKKSMRGSSGRGSYVISKKSGRKYWRAKDPVIRSSPGEPPRVQSGTLRRSISWASQRRGNRLNLYVGVMKGMATAGAEPYALELELGSPRVKRRPYLSSAVARARNNARVARFFRR